MSPPEEQAGATVREPRSAPRAGRVVDPATPAGPHPAMIGLGVACGAVLVGALAASATSLAVLAAVALALVLAVVARPDQAVLVVVAVVPVVAGLRRDLPVPFLRLSEVLVLGLLGTVLIASWKGWRPRWSGLEWATLAYSVATVVLVSLGVVATGERLDLVVVVTLLLPLHLLLLSRAPAVTLITATRRRLALRALLLASVPVSAITYLQYLDVGPAAEWTAQLTGSDAVAEAVRLGFAARATGPFDHWHVLAGYLLPIVLITAALLLERDQRVMSRPGLGAVLVLALLALALTFTFTAAFGVLAGVAIIGILTSRFAALLRGGAVLAVVVLGLLGPLVGERVAEQFQPRPGQTAPVVLPETIDYRLEVWQDQYLGLIADSPLVGYGLEMPATIEWVYSESMYLNLQLRGGFLLVVAFGALVWAFLATMGPLARNADVTVRVPARVVLASTLVLIPMHAVFPYFASPGLPQVLWLLAGVALAGRWHRRPQPDAPRHAEASR